MRVLLFSVLIILSTSAFAGEKSTSRWIRVTASEDQTLRHIQVCNVSKTKCSQLGKKAAYTVGELSKKHEEIRKLRNRSIARTYALALISFIAAPSYLGPAVMSGQIYGGYNAALAHMDEIQLAFETEDFGVAEILVESPYAVEVIRTVLDARHES